MKTSYSPLYRSVVTALASSNLTPKALTIVSALAVCMPAMAAQNRGEVDAEQPRINFPAITVTATRTPTAVNNTIAQTRVIDSQELSTYKGQTVLDVLKRQPGFSYYQSGGMGTKSSFYLRGYDSQSILVLIDGIRYNAASTGRAALELFPADQIDHIEILYGASGSSIYGADAVGGVIQIFTKGQNVDQNQFSVTAGAGSNDHYLYGASAQMRNEKGSSLSLAASRNQTKGIDAIKSGGDAYKDDDGFNSNNFSLSMQHKLNDAVTIGANGIYAKSNTEYDSGSTFIDANQDNKNYVFNTFVDIENKGLNTKLQYGESTDKRVNFDKNSPNGSFFDTKDKQANLQLTYPTNMGTLTGGAEWLRQEADTSLYAGSHERKIKSIFTGYLLNTDQFDAQANVRYDDNSQFGSETTYNVGGAYKFSPELRAGASFSTGFRAPSLDTMYDNFSGNPNLKPETSDNYEVFIEKSNDHHKTRLTGYYSDVEDLIDYDGGNNWRMGNIDKARIKGITLVSDWIVNQYIFGMNYDYQDAKNLSGDYKGEQIKFRPKHKGSVYAGYRNSEFDVRAEVQHIGKRYALDGEWYGPTRLGTKIQHANLVNLSANYYVSPNLTINSQINNLFNKEYTSIDTYGTRYNEDGTNFFTSLTYTWK